MKFVSSPNEDPTSPNYPIQVSDLANMFRRRILKQDGILDREVISLNNKKVDEWYEKVLLKIADSKGNIATGRAVDCFRYFTEGLEIIQCRKYREHMPVFTEENAKFWVRFLLEKDIEEIYELGTIVVTRAWSYITGYLRDYFAEQRWEKVYSKSDNPHVWDRLANDHPHLMHGRPLPFGLFPDTYEDIQNKVQVLLKYAIQPRKQIESSYIQSIEELVEELSFRIPKNERPLDVKVMSLNNKKIKRLEKNFLRSLADEKGLVKRGEALRECLFQLEKEELLQYEKSIAHFEVFSEEKTGFWIDFLRHNSIEDLHRVGMTVVSSGYAIIQSFIKDYFANLRIEKMRSDSTWSSSNDIDYSSLPLNLTHETLQEIAQKVGVIFAYPLQPRN